MDTGPVIATAASSVLVFIDVLSVTAMRFVTDLEVEITPWFWISNKIRS